MEVKINREIRNYTESMFFGLSMRQFIFSILAVVVAVGLYFLIRPYAGTETVSWVYKVKRQDGSIETENCLYFPDLNSVLPLTST